MRPTKFIKILAMSALFLAASSCTYRFSNQYLKPPSGIKTVYIEPAFDTSGNAVNHQDLTKAFENAIAKDGKLAIKKSENADLYVRFKLKSVSRNQFNIGLRNATSEPELSIDAPAINDFPDMKTPNKFANKEKASINVEVEFWNLKTRKLLFKKLYARAASYSILDTNTDRENRYLRYEEAFTNNFKSISNSIAIASLRDFYIDSRK
jgi:hypothetical protein